MGIVTKRFQSLVVKLCMKSCEEDRAKKKKRVDKKLVPSGFLPIYVGEECKRYLVPVSCLSSILFKALLHQFQEKIQASISGPIMLPCSPQLFEWVLNISLYVEAKKS